MMGMLYSMAGGVLCWVVMCLVKPLIDRRHIWVMSMRGAVGHNVGQLAVAVWVSGTAAIALYAPVLLLAGLVTGFPYVVWELWRFIKPALHEKERRYANGIVFYTSFLFITGVLFGYYIITPMTVNFLGNYQVSTEVQNMISLDSFISTVTTMTLITGIVFELPIVVYFLSKVGILSPKFMRDYRKHAIVVILILSAVITPTSDATTLIMVAIPLYILYEVSIFVSAYVVRGKQAVQ